MGFSTKKLSQNLFEFDAWTFSIIFCVTKYSSSFLGDHEQNSTFLLMHKDTLLIKVLCPTISE